MSSRSQLTVLWVAAALSACSVDAASFTPAACGDGFLSATEECDDSNLVDGDGCDSNCRPTGCGNSAVSAGELCDDGNTVDGDGCDSNCRVTECGNGIKAGDEQCDDGNKDTEPCVYGPQTSCMICSATCQLVSAPPRFCGDGFKQEEGFEACDDGNATCGTCSVDCQVSGFLSATGEIHVVAPGLLDNETFTVGDGFHDPVTFQYSRTGTTTDQSYILIDISALPTNGGGNLVRAPTIDAINSVGDQLWITASGSSGTTVFLTHDRPTAIGNVAITEDVDAGSFSVLGMAYGAGGDCASGQPCRSDDDCVYSATCQQDVCQ